GPSSNRLANSYGPYAANSPCCDGITRGRSLSLKEAGAYSAGGELMKQHWHNQIAYFGLSVVTSLFAATFAGCSPTAPTEIQTATATVVATATSLPAPAGSWAELMQRTPYPFTAPLPEPADTALDGTYVKVDPRPGERAGCRRCPPYPPEGGVWKW
ncbi:MAG: hypothetical protein ACE5HA_12465, partial [Anaerolineae bacterium]